MTQIVLTLLTILLLSCMSTEEKEKCLDRLIVEASHRPLQTSIRSAIEDSLRSWAVQGVSTTSQFNDSNYQWKIDGLFLNSQETKLFGWLLQRSVTSEADNLDYIKYFSGESINGVWYYYIHNMPKTFFDHEDNQNTPHDFQYLSKYAKNEVIDGGLIDIKRCEVNDPYINGWIEREGRNLYQWHLDFLEKRE